METYESISPSISPKIYPALSPYLCSEMWLSTQTEGLNLTKACGAAHLMKENKSYILNIDI